MSLFTMYDGHNLHRRARSVVSLTTSVQWCTVLSNQLMFFVTVEKMNKPFRESGITNGKKLNKNETRSRIQKPRFDLSQSAVPHDLNRDSECKQAFHTNMNIKVTVIEIIFVWDGFLAMSNSYVINNRERNENDKKKAALVLNGIVSITNLSGVSPGLAPSSTWASLVAYSSRRECMSSPPRAEPDALPCWGDGAGDSKASPANIGI